MGKQYAFPDLGEIGSTISRAGQSMQRRQQQTPPISRGQRLTPLQGITAGLLRHQRSERMKVEDEQDSMRQEALMLLSAIPDSEENTPKKLRALASILSMKPGKGGKFNLEEVFNPTPDLEYKANMLKKVMDMIPQEGQTPQEGQVSFAEVEDQQAKLGTPLFTGDGEAVYPTIVNGKLVMQSAGKLQTAAQTIADKRVQGGGVTMTPDDKKILTEAKVIAAKNKHTWEDLDESQRKIYVDIARNNYADDLETKRKIAEKRPDLMDSSILANNATLPGKVTSPTGLTPAQELAENNRISAEARAIIDRFNRTRGEYLRAWTERKLIENDSAVRNVDGTLKTLPNGNLDTSLLGREAREKWNVLKGKIDQFESDMDKDAIQIDTVYGASYGVERDKYNIPTNIFAKPTVKPSKTPQSGARTEAGRVKGKAGGRPIGIDSMLDLKDVLMPNGQAGFAIDDGWQMKAPIQVHPWYEREKNVFVVDSGKVSIASKTLGTIINIPGVNGNFEIVYVSPGGRVVVQKQ